MDRRRFIRQGAAVTAGAWAAPSLLTGTAWAAPKCCCTGDAYDVRLVTTGMVTGVHGPFNRLLQADGCPKDDCLVDLTGTVPGATEPFVTASTACVGHDFTGGTQPCTTFEELQSVDADLRQVHNVLDVQLVASVVRADAAARCGNGSSADSHLADAVVTIAGQPVPLEAHPAPNTVVALPANPLLDVFLVLNEQTSSTTATSVGSTVNAIHLHVRDHTTGQTADLIVGRAEASCSCT